MNGTVRVGIAGARGIGRHQAKWFSQLGCEVAAIYGTSQATAAAAAEAVQALCDFHGRVEHCWEQFVRAPDLDAVSICSPPEAHAANVLDALRAGKHVMCEKPLLWDWESGSDRLMATAREMVQTAHAVDRVLAMNAQYPAAVPALLQLYQQANNREPDWQNVVFRMETAGAPRSAHGAAEVWADLAPHPIAFIDRLLPGGAPDLGSATRAASEASGVLLRLDWRWPGGPTSVTLDLRRVKDKSAIRREVALDGWTVHYQGRNIDGEFRTALVAPPYEWVGEDLMRTSLRRFVEAVRSGDPDRVLLSGDDALRQFEVQLALWERCFK
jgi:predicted dehydrogenase